MANKSDLESYIMRCARKYEQKHPEVKIHARKTVELPIEECLYCSGKKPIADIPFSVSMVLSKDKLFIEWENEMIGIDVNYCPICGKEI